MTSATSANTAGGSTPASVRLVRAAAVLAAMPATSVIYLAARALGTDFKLTDPGKTEAHQLILPEIIGFTALFALLGWASLAVLERITRRAKRVWAMLAGTVLVLSFVPIGIEQAGPATKAMLSVIHITVAAALLTMLRTRGRPRG